MIHRKHGNLTLRRGEAPAASVRIEHDGYALVRDVLSPDEVSALADEIVAIFASSGPERGRPDRAEFRYGMFNRSPLAQAAIAKRAILDVIEPLLGEDCHVIANTAWKNRLGHTGGRWHIDAGPHVPRPEGVPWPEAIPYPIFAIGVHIFLEDCTLAHGPTAVIPGSHKSGRLPPYLPEESMDLEYEGAGPLMLPAKAGDAIFFASDVWHRGTPAQDGHGRFFLQCHYGRRDIAQRVRLTDEATHALPEAVARAGSERERQLIGQHQPFFYDG
jgi:ectoine hydroxylase-related dioxygenase (phytanoyl-CoA dioxygenase family)